MPTRWYLIKRGFRFFFQRFFRGWDDSQTWNLDARLAEHILPRLKRFKQLNNCTPMDLTGVEWDHILDQMIFAFEWAAADCVDRAEDKETFARVQAGMDLFARFYFDLWW